MPTSYLRTVYEIRSLEVLPVWDSQGIGRFPLLRLANLKLSPSFEPPYLRNYLTDRHEISVKGPLRSKKKYKISESTKFLKYVINVDEFVI
jgi:hypothetical protein